MRKVQPKRGGARKGAGRKTPDGASGMTNHNVSLDVVTYHRLLEIGGGNLSAGIRIAARQAKHQTARAANSR